MELDLIFLMNPILGGAERVLKIIAEESASSGRYVKIIFLCDSDESAWTGMNKRVDCVSIGARNAKIGLLAMYSMIKKISREYDVKRAYSSQVHLNGMLCLYRSMGVLKCEDLIIRESTVIADRFKGLRKYEFLLFYHFYQGIDLLICQTEYMRERLQDFVPRLEALKPVVIANPVNAKRAERMAKEPILNTEKYGKYIVTVGRLIETKGGDLLIQAFAQVLQRYPSMNLLFIGDGGERAYWQSLAEKSGILDHVFFLGHIDNPFPYLKRSELGVIASRREGFPNVLLEMMAVCQRVVSTHCAGGIAEIPGIYDCPANNENALAEAMIESLEGDSKLRVELMRNEVFKRTPKAFLDKIAKSLTK